MNILSWRAAAIIAATATGVLGGTSSTASARYITTHCDRNGEGCYKVRCDDDGDNCRRVTRNSEDYDRRWNQRPDSYGDDSGSGRYSDDDSYNSDDRYDRDRDSSDGSGEEDDDSD